MQASAAAKRTLAVLDSMASADSAFQAVFLPRHRPTSSHDHFWRVELAAKQDEENLLRCDRIPWRYVKQFLAVNNYCIPNTGQLTCLLLFSEV